MAEAVEKKLGPIKYNEWPIACIPKHEILTKRIRFYNQKLISSKELKLCRSTEIQREKNSRTDPGPKSSAHNLLKSTEQNETNVQNRTQV